MIPSKLDARIGRSKCLSAKQFNRDSEDGV